MIRALLPLVALLLLQAADAQKPGPKGNSVACSLSAAGSADDMLDSILYIWASVERCGRTHDAVQCTVDVSYAIESVNHMINFILKAAQKCGHAFEGRAKCGLAVGELTEALAGVTATSGGIVERCPNPNKPHDIPAKAAPFLGQMVFPHKFAHCVIDMKSTIKVVFKAAMRLSTLKDNCQDNPQGRYCSRNILQVVAAFAEMGEYISGAVGHCSKPGNEDAACASEILGLLRELDNMAKAGDTMSKDCSLSDSERLFLEDDEDDVVPTTGFSFMNIGLMALIPVSAVMSFLAGRRIRGRRDIESQALESAGEE